MVAGLGAVTLDIEQSRAERYSAGRVRFYLRHYHVLESVSPRHPDEPKVRISRAFQWARWERACEIRADLDRAIAALAELPPDRFFAHVIQKYYVQGESAEHIATILRVEVDTVKGAKEDAVAWICNFLNGDA